MRNQSKPNNFKFIDLSSESDDDSDKENFDSRTYSKQPSCDIHASNRPCTLE